MSHSKHHPKEPLGVTLRYVKEELGQKRKCPRRGCHGCMVEVWVRYENRGPINHEQECTECGKTVKDPRFKRERDRHWTQQEDRRRNSCNENYKTRPRNR